MSKAKFDAAKELIKEKKYDQARSLLSTIDHPTAREWEAKLGRIDPSLPDFPIVKQSSNEKPKKRGCASTIVVIALLLLCIVSLPILTNPQAGTVSKQSLDNVVKNYGGSGATFTETAVRVSVTFQLSQWDESTAINDAKIKMIDLLCGMKDNGFEHYAVTLTGSALFSDAFGNEHREKAVSAQFTPAIIQQIDCKNKYDIRVLEIGQDVYIHPVLY